MKEIPSKGNDFWVSRYNQAAMEELGLTLPPRVIIHDSTLRDGEQTPGVALNWSEKVKLAAALDEAGVDRIEAGMPVVSEDDRRAFKEIMQLGLRADVLAFCRAKKEDLEASVACGVRKVCIEVPAGEPRLKYQFNWSEQHVIDLTLEILTYAKGLGLDIILFPYDTTRADIEFLRRYISIVDREARPAGLVIVDTLGCALPEAINYLVREIKKVTTIPLEVHTHNDFGMGVATTLAGIRAGVTAAHVCVNGLGERCGNAGLAEVAVALKYLLGVETGIKLDGLTKLSREVEAVTGIPVQKNAPVVGANVFTRETGIGIEMQRKNPLVIYPVAPESIGQKAKPLLGKKSGRMSIRLRLEDMGLEASDDQVGAILEEVKSTAIATKRLVDDETFEEILNKHGVLRKEVD
ncbi:hypothetical protein SY88_12430 [Clostridiales bacterium PH28_bin88]|nr:hypothetical protein SY88_12430 [Clostridiales bacterium PH28_bin88]